MVEGGGHGETAILTPTLMHQNQKQSLAGRLAVQAQTPEARAYAVKELARRAGVSRDFFRRWTIETTNLRTTVSFPSVSTMKIHFDSPPEELLSKLASGNVPVARARNLLAPEIGVAGQDLIVPFSDLPSDPAKPLFQKAEDGSFACNAYLLFSIVFTLSRAEEVISAIRDEHGRFPASASVATHHDFLERPIVDEYGSAFAQVLSAILPSWRPEPSPITIKLTHDIDSVGIPLRPRTTFGHTLKRKHPFSTVRDLLAPLTDIAPAELSLVQTLAKTSISRRQHSSFYWKASARTPMDDGYDLFHPKVQAIIQFLKGSGFEMGAHPGYYTFGSRTELLEEINRLREALNSKISGGRQHYLRWSPETWLDWEACGLTYDSSVGFADRIGFRAGTAKPFRPWSLRQNREIKLVEVPLLLMDCTLVKYMGLRRVEAFERIRLLIKRTTRAGGVFTMLWHNVPLMEPEYRGWYEPILDMLQDARPFVVPESPDALW